MKRWTGGCVRFEVVMAVNSKVVIVWNVIPCSLVDDFIYQNACHVLEDKYLIVGEEHLRVIGED